MNKSFTVIAVAAKGKHPGTEKIKKAPDLSEAFIL